MFTISEQTYGTIDFTINVPKLPEAKISNIPNSVSYESRNAFGNFFCQKVEQPHYSFWKSVYRPTEDLTFHVTEDDVWLGFRLILKKSIRHIKGAHLVNMMQGQINFNYAPKVDNKFQIKKGEEYEVFDMRVSKDWLTQLNIVEEEFELFLNKTALGLPMWLSDKPCWGNAIVLDTLELLLKEPSKESIAQELLKQVVLSVTKKRFNERKMNEHQVERMFYIRNEMKKHLLESIPLKQWASKAQMNITYFKDMFRQVFGLTPYHFLIYERLKAAKELARQSPDLSNAEIAQLCGFGNYNNLRRAFTANENKTLSNWRRQSDTLLFLMLGELVREEWF